MSTAQLPDTLSEQEAELAKQVAKKIEIGCPTAALITYVPIHYFCNLIV